LLYPFWANLYQKLQISAILGAVSPHFKSDNVFNALTEKR